MKRVRQLKWKFKPLPRKLEECSTHDPNVIYYSGSGGYIGFLSCNNVLKVKPQKKRRELTSLPTSSRRETHSRKG